MTVDQALAAVVRGGAEGRDEGTWITAEMIDAYEQLHRLVAAHSVEAWHEGELVGGLYGVALGGLFAGESMFTRGRDASNVAVASLVERLRLRGFTLFDIQFVTPHTSRLGAIEIPRAEYLHRLQAALRLTCTFA